MTFFSVTYFLGDFFPKKKVKRLFPCNFFFQVSYFLGDFLMTFSRWLFFYQVTFSGWLSFLGKKCHVMFFPRTMWEQEFSCHSKCPIYRYFKWCMSRGPLNGDFDYFLFQRTVVVRGYRRKIRGKLQDFDKILNWFDKSTNSSYQGSYLSMSRKHFNDGQRTLRVICLH